ncbi:exopolysaccharide biosynthesis polyprenyl glycosylphosphotransferase [Salinicola avicenniae]|uniref:exopolysaccharide biosynthesis polyprenyl glycosylphosphotransferase n=1 Tax=Salinicola avicenniae TaxID=2916836 RepID=UPI0020731893|nr:MULTISPECIES: exopolysaccharide biosynthesis polyprenyl glycosylphosphotransferase [unclassified Salinicola]
MEAKYERRHSRWYERLLFGLPLQFLVGLPIVALTPAVLRWGWQFWEYMPDVRGNTLLAIILSFTAIVFTLRRIMRYPGVQVVSFILPAVSIAYLIVVAALFFTREGYTRQVLFYGYVLCLGWFFLGYLVGRRYRSQKLAVVPLGQALMMRGGRQVELRFLTEPNLESVRFDGVVADFYAKDMTPEWEKFIAKCTLFHIPVYNVKQIEESITGRVQIEHLAENEFGTLLPSSFYAAVKRSLDIVGAVLFLPLLLPLLVGVAFFIKKEDMGPVFFVQQRMGYRARPFRMYKFRTMRCGEKGAEFTHGNDPRITRIGKWLRKYRFDELPQIINVLKGEMSFIGPRPETTRLSIWYERDVPFFSYRHVVRPGISGWAQVNQGYAAEVDGMRAKLQYDFYYIKHFSLWLDLLIFLKTFKTMLTGFGSR